MTPLDSRVAKGFGLWLVTLVTIVSLVGWPMTLGLAAERPSAVPAATAADWSNNPEASFAAVLADNEKLNKLVAEYQGMLSKAAWVGATIGTVLAIARFVPGVQQPIADMLYNLWASRRTKAEEEKQLVMATGFKEVAEIMRAFPKDAQLGQVLDKLARDLPEPVKQVYRELEKNEFDIRPGSPAA